MRRKPNMPYYIAILMPATGLGANQVRYYKPSRDLRQVFRVERRLNPKGWKQAFIESLIVVPNRKYKNRDAIPDDLVTISLAKVIGITQAKPKLVITPTRSQFVLVDDWTTKVESLNHLRFVQHDYNIASKAKIAQDWDYWRQLDNRLLAQKCHQAIMATLET